MVVTKLYHWDERAHVIYFRATRAGAPGERHLYTVKDFESGDPGAVQCLSCEVKNSRYIMDIFFKITTHCLSAEHRMSTCN